MKYFVPELALGALLPPQTQVAEKFGGLPWGLPLEQWPLCQECGNPQTHLATLIHHAECLDLGKEGRAVLVFQCGHSPNETDCETWEADSGANAVVFLDAEDIGEELIPPPVPGAVREIEMRVVQWEERHDLVTEDLKPFFYKSAGFWDFREAHEAETDSLGSEAKLGSMPSWVQTAEDIDPAFQFAAQLTMYYHFPDPLPTADEAGVTINVSPPKHDWTTGYTITHPTAPDANTRGEIYVSDLTHERYGSGFDVEAAEFGDGGIAYLFINPDPVAPKGLFM